MTSEQEETCPVCQHPFYPGCRNRFGGGGNIIRLREDNTEYAETCPNNKRRRLRMYMDRIHPDLWSRPHCRDTPLFSKSEGIDRTKDNLFFPSVDVGTFLAHLKWVAGYKCGPNAFLKYTSDTSLVGIFVGNNSYKSQVRSRIEDSTFVCNSLEEFLESPDLVIVQLGVLRHSNRAAANVMKETMVLRQRWGKPLWLIEPEDVSYTPYHKTDFGGSEGSPSCDDEVLNYINHHFERVELEVIEEARLHTTVSYEIDEEEDTVSLGEEPLSEFNAAVVEEDELEVSEEPAEDDDSDLSDILKEGNEPKKWNKGKRRRY